MVAWLLLTLLSPAGAARKKSPAVPRVPTVDEVVLAEGFTPTPSQSEVYRPGAVLVPNERGSHDEVVSDCIGVEPNVAIMSQSSIATTLSAGVSARLGVGAAAASAGIEKRLTFIDPEQRTIPLGMLQPTDDCMSQLETAGRLADLSEAIVVHDVLVAIIQNTVCTKADAKGGVVALGQAEAAAFSECIQESDAQVPLGFKGVELSRLMGTPAAPPVAAAPSPGTPPAAVSTVAFASDTLDVSAKLREQECLDEARQQVAQARTLRLDEAAATAQAQASAAWSALEDQAQACTQLPRGDRSECIRSVEGWLQSAEAMVVSLPEADEPAQTACGTRAVASAAESRPVRARELSAAKRLLADLQSENRAVAEEQAPAPAAVPVTGHFAAEADAWIPLTKLPSVDKVVRKARAVASESPSTLVVLASKLDRKRWRDASDRPPLCRAARAESTAQRQRAASSVDRAQLKADIKEMNRVLPTEAKSARVSPIAMASALSDATVLIAVLNTQPALADKDIERACK